MTGGELRPDEHYDGERFADVVFDETAAGNCLFLDCSFVNVSFREGRLRKCRFTDTTMREVRIVATDLAETAWQDVTLTGCALAGVQAHSADWRRVVFLEGKLDSVNFRGGTFADVRFENCLLPTSVDLRGASLGIADGLGSLAGSTIDSVQLLALAPQLAQHLGITVAD